MTPSHASRILLGTWLERSNKFIENIKEEETKDYLQETISVLESSMAKYRSESRNKSLPPRIRARARDMEQNVMGLINGIKFSIELSLIDRKDLVSGIQEASDK